jgi:diacylglycerol kinase family enzyme
VAEVTIRGRDGVDVNVDGEMVGYRGRVALELLPSAWQVLVPPAG